jgi:hypothetical protein
MVSTGMIRRGAISLTEVTDKRVFALIPSAIGDGP